MQRYLIMGLIIASGVPLSCDSAPRSNLSSLDESADEHSHVATLLAEARDAEADAYAPAYFNRAEEAFRVRDNLERAESLARQATTEARMLRAEVKEAADEHLRRADILLQLVETIVANDPPNRFAFPDENEFEALRHRLQRANDAYERGDYINAGVVAQSVSEALAGPSRTTS